MLFTSKILYDWIDEAHIKENEVQFKLRDHTLTIYTPMPGYLIGYKGELVNKYKPLLEKKHRSNLVIKFEETDRMLTRKDANDPEYPIKYMQARCALW